MTTEQTTNERRKELNETAPVGILDTIIRLGTATTNLAIDQVGNAFTALVHPTVAIDHVKETLLNISDAMNNSAAAPRNETSAGPSHERIASDLRGASDGMEYVSTEHVRTSPFVDVRTPGGTVAHKVSAVKINRRKG